MNTPYIICSAIWYNDGIERIHLPRNINTGIVVSGWRHFNCFPQLKEIFNDRKYITSDNGRNVIQGFLTSDGNFVDRIVAFEIAKNSGQYNGNKSEGKLYSEDIY